jgi:hypothetical protein
MSNQVKTHVDAIPGDDKAHAHSHAAHLHDNGNAHISSVGVGKQGREPGAIQQPPQDPKRNGKTHSHQ